LAKKVKLQNIKENIIEFLIKNKNTIPVIKNNKYSRLINKYSHNKLDINY
jgi:hypothetical protein